MPKTEFQNEVINRIRQLRIDNDVSQIGMAKIIDVGNGQIGNIESTKFQHKYTLKHLFLISIHFKVPMEFILTGSAEKLSTDELIKILIKYDE